MSKLSPVFHQEFCESNPNARQVLRQVLFRWRIDRARPKTRSPQSGPHWTAHDRNYWCAWLVARDIFKKLSPSSFDRRVCELVKAGYLEKESHRFRGPKKVLFLRPTRLACELEGTHSDMAFWSASESPKSSDFDDPVDDPVDETCDDTCDETCDETDYTYPSTLQPFHPSTHQSEGETSAVATVSATDSSPSSEGLKKGLGTASGKVEGTASEKFYGSLVNEYLFHSTPAYVPTSLKEAEFIRDMIVKCSCPELADVIDLIPKLRAEQKEFQQKKIGKATYEGRLAHLLPRIVGIYSPNTHPLVMFPENHFDFMTASPELQAKVFVKHIIWAREKLDPHPYQKVDFIGGALWLK